MTNNPTLLALLRGTSEAPWNPQTNEIAPNPALDPQTPNYLERLSIQLPKQEWSPEQDPHIALNFVVKPPTVRTGSWTGPPRGEMAPRVITTTVFGVRGVRALVFRKESCSDTNHKPQAPWNPQTNLSPYTKVYSVIFDSGSIPD